MRGLRMGLGLSRVAVSGGGGGAWTPASPSVALAAWFDPTDISTLFKDTAGTVPVTADGDIVRRINDKSGNGFNATQPYNALWGPVYRTGSGKPYLEVAAASHQWLETSSAQIVNASTGEHSAGVAINFTNNTGTQRPLEHSGTGATVFISNVAGTSTVIAKTGAGTTFTDTGPAITASAATTLVEVTSTTATEIFVNGTGDGSTSVSSALNTAALQLGICGLPGSDATVNGKLYQAILYRGALGSSDRASLVSYLAAKM